MAGKKKKKQEIFNMDDGDTSEVAGGLNDAPEFDETGDEIEFIDHVELDDEPDAEPEPEPEETPEPEPDVAAEPETTPEEEPESEPEPEKKVDPAEERYLNMVAMIAKKDAQLETLVGQVQALTEKVIKPATEPEPVEPLEAPTPPNPDDMDWNEYTDAKIEYVEKQRAYEAELRRREEDSTKSAYEKEQAEKLKNIQAIHAADYACEAEDIPALRDNEIIRNKWAEIYYNPATAYNTKPDGVFRAVRALKALAKKDGVDLRTFGQKPADPVKEQTKEPAIDPEKLKADEAARLQRVAIGSISGSGKEPTSTGVNVDQSLRDAAEKFGVPLDQYIKTFKALGGKV